MNLNSDCLLLDDGLLPEAACFLYPVPLPYFDGMNEPTSLPECCIHNTEVQNEAK